MGWDDNGLPTERRVQNYYGVRCDTSLPYDPQFTPPAKPDTKRPLPVSRRNFIELCEELVKEEKKPCRIWCPGHGVPVAGIQGNTPCGITRGATRHNPCHR